MLDQKRLKEILSYCPITGVFVNISNVGKKVGCVNGDGYIHIKIKGCTYKAHRLAYLYMEGEWPKKQIDHEDHNRANNSWSNLRSVDSQGNNRNRGKSSLNESGFTGVSWHKKRGKWDSYIYVNRKRIHIGSFKDKFVAIGARKEAEQKYGFHENHGT